MANVVLRYRKGNEHVPKNIVDWLEPGSFVSAEYPEDSDLVQIIVDDSVFDAAAVCTEMMVYFGCTLIATNPSDTLTEAIEAELEQYNVSAGVLMVDGSQAMTGDLNLNSHKISGYKQAQYDIQPGGTSGAITYSCDDGVAFNSALDGNATSISVIDKPAAGKGMKITIIFVQDSTPRTLPGPWTGVDLWTNGSDPVIPTDEGKVLVAVLDVSNPITIGSWWAQP